MTLDEIAVKYKSPRSSLGHSYMTIYESYFKGARDLPVKLLEIGIDKGDSIKIWEEYFPNAKITAIDINPRCAQYATDRTEVIIADQGDEEFLKHFFENHQTGFDIIIDDGSHVSKDQVKSIAYFFQTLCPGGLYAVEDIQTSYDERYGGGIMNQNRIVEIFKAMIDRLNVYGKSQINDFKRSRSVAAVLLPEYNALDEHINSIHFYCGLIIFTKFAG